jgi:hypothetical protein
MSSRFFHGGDSDSESSSSDEEELYSDHEERSDEESEEEDEDEDDSDSDSSSDDDGAGKGAARFLKPSGGGDASDSDESDEEERVVKSAKDKRLDELQQTITAIRNAEKINDWATISTGGFLVHQANSTVLTTDRIRQDEQTGHQNCSARRLSKDLCQNDSRPRRVDQRHNREAEGFDQEDECQQHQRSQCHEAENQKEQRSLH